MNHPMSQRSPIFKYTVIGFSVLAIVLAISLSGRLMENVAADEILVIQDPIDGELHFYFEPGLKAQNFGKPTRYPRRDQLWFADPLGKVWDETLGFPINFNEGGAATVFGSVSWYTPRNREFLKKVHSDYGSWERLETDLIKPIFSKAIYMSGPLMSSRESFAEKKNELIKYVIDQVENGIYRTVSREAKVIDALSGVEKTVTKVEIVTDPTAPNGLARQEVSLLKEYGIDFDNFSLIRIVYDEKVQKQIETQRQAIMEVETSVAEAKKAEQQTIKAEKEGQARAAEAKWAQEAEKATVVTKAEQERDIMRLQKEQAEFQKQRDILIGQGEAEKKRLTLSADGALQQKIEAWIEVNKYYADAIAKYQGNWVPTTVIGSGPETKANAGGAQTLIDLLTAKTARDLSLDLSIPKGKQE